MKAKLINEQEPRTYAVIFDKGDEVMAGLEEFVGDNGLDAGHLTAIGAFSDVILGYFDRARRKYKEIPLHEQVEVLSLVGDIALEENTPKLHVHVVVGKSDGSAWGGHVLEAHVWPTLEVIVQEAPGFLRRQSDPETGLALIRV